LVTPLPSRFNGQPGRVLVTLRSEAAAPTFDPATLWRLFKLTPAEARLALAIAAGRSLAQIGGEHQVSENTLRTQLASILRKTGTANQRELVRILNLLPLLYRPAAPGVAPVPPVR
jgi:DNA-binding CsgD family transcriptional regulator